MVRNLAVGLLVQKMNWKIRNWLELVKPCIYPQTTGKIISKTTIKYVCVKYAGIEKSTMGSSNMPT